VRFESQITSDGSGTIETEHILQAVNNYELLTCANPVAPSSWLDPNEPLYWQAGGLMSPFFYKDAAHPLTSNELTFFVQPTLKEKTIGEWEGWAVGPPMPVQDWSDGTALDRVVVTPQVPAAGPVVVSVVDPVYSVYPMQVATDWATDPATAIVYGTRWIGRQGAIDVAAVSATPAATPVASTGNVLSGSPGRATSLGLNLVGAQGIDLNRFQTKG
jgi:hypothetical protein